MLLQLQYSELSQKSVERNKNAKKLMQTILNRGINVSCQLLFLFTDYRESLAD